MEQGGSGSNDSGNGAAAKAATAAVVGTTLATVAVLRLSWAAHLKRQQVATCCCNLGRAWLRTAVVCLCVPRQAVHLDHQEASRWQPETLPTVHLARFPWLLVAASRVVGLLSLLVLAQPRLAICLCFLVVR